MIASNFINMYHGFRRNRYFHLQVKIQLFCLRLKAAIACESLLPVYQKHAVAIQNTFIFALTTMKTSTSNRPAQKQTTVAGLNMFLQHGSFEHRHCSFETTSRRQRYYINQFGAVCVRNDESITGRLCTPVQSDRLCHRRRKILEIALTL